MALATACIVRGCCGERRSCSEGWPETAEFNRIWTHSAYRRRGLARFVLAELESLAARSGYRRVYLTTGPRQPEAMHLYLSTGYEAQFDLSADPDTGGPLAFTKNLERQDGSRRSGSCAWKSSR